MCHGHFSSHPSDFRSVAFWVGQDMVGLFYYTDVRLVRFSTISGPLRNHLIDPKIAKISMSLKNHNWIKFFIFIYIFLPPQFCSGVQTGQVLGRPGFESPTRKTAVYTCVPVITKRRTVYV